jgi:hypothetical protein
MPPVTLSTPLIMCEIKELTPAILGHTMTPRLDGGVQMAIEKLTEEQNTLLKDLIGLVDNETRGQTGNPVKGRRIQGNLGYCQTLVKKAREQFDFK